MLSPIDGSAIGEVSESNEATVAAAMATALDGFPAWAATPVAKGGGGATVVVKATSPRGGVAEQRRRVTLSN